MFKSICIFYRCLSISYDNNQSFTTQLMYLKKILFHKSLDRIYHVSYVYPKQLTRLSEHTGMRALSLVKLKVPCQITITVHAIWNLWIANNNSKVRHRRDGQFAIKHIQVQFQYSRDIYHYDIIRLLK